MRSVFAILYGFLFLILVTHCGGGHVLVESTPRPTPAPPVEPVKPPASPLSIEATIPEWIPPAIGSGLGAKLAEVLEKRSALAVILPKNRMTPLAEDRVYQMIKAAAPETKIVARARAMLDKIMEERGEIPYRTTLEPAGTDILGRPYYLPKEHPLTTEWLLNKSALKGADTLLTVRPIAVDDRKLREMREGRQGGCDEALTALAKKFNWASSFFAPFEKEANEKLKRAMTRHLEAAMPFWRSEIEITAKSTKSGEPTSRCASIYDGILQRIEAATKENSKEYAPQFITKGGGLIGMPDLATLMTGECPTAGMRDYLAEIYDLAGRAVAEVIPALGDEWTNALLRAGGLDRLQDGVKEICKARHRRFDHEEFEQSRIQVATFLKNIASNKFSGQWETARGMERVPGRGPMRVLARVRASGEDPRAEAVHIIDQLRRIERCDEGEEEILHVVMVDVGSSEVLFSGILFAEELLCEGLPPGSP